MTFYITYGQHFMLGKNSTFEAENRLTFKGVTEVRSKILTPLEITGGNSFSLEGFEKMLFTI